MELTKTLFSKWLNDSRLNREDLDICVQLSQDLPQKIKHFGLEGKRLEEEIGRASMLDCALNISIEKENLRFNQPEEVFKYASRLEEKYAADIAQLKFFSDRIKGKNDFYHAFSRIGYLLHHMDDQERLMHALEDESSVSTYENPLHSWFLQLKKVSVELETEEKILASWFVHYAVLTCLPSLKNYPVLARLAQQLYLQSEGLDADGTIFLNTELIRRQQAYKRISDQLKFKDADSLLQSDLYGILNFGLSAHRQALENANLNLRELYQEKIEFDEYTPRQRNMVNYFFEEGFRLQLPKGKIAQNERHKQILEFIYEHHFASTKDLSLIYRLNRKTIQRDFNELMDLGVVRSMGNGAALRYTVPIRNNPFGALEKCQNISLGEQPVQISLFGDMDAYSAQKTQSEVEN